MAQSSEDTEKPVSRRFIISQKKVAFDEDSTLSAGAVTVVATLQVIQPKSQLIPIELSISYGLGDDPADGETVRWFLAVIDLDNVISLTGIQRNADWARIQHWRTYTPSGSLVQTIVREEEQFIIPQVHNSLSLEDRKRRKALVLAAHSSAASATLNVGTASWQETLIQNNWKGDNSYNELEDDGEENGDYFADDGDHGWG